MYKHCAVNQETNITPTNRVRQDSRPVLTYREKGKLQPTEPVSQPPSLPKPPCPRGQADRIHLTKPSFPSYSELWPPPAAGSTKSKQRMVQTIGSGTDPIQSLACEAYLPKLVTLNSAILDFGRSNLFFLTLIDNSTEPYLRSARLK